MFTMRTSRQPALDFDSCIVLWLASVHHGRYRHPASRDTGASVHNGRSRGRGMMEGAMDIKASYLLRGVRSGVQFVLDAGPMVQYAV